MTLSAKTLATTPIMALPPEAGAIGAVRTHAYVNGLRQDISLKSGAARGVENGMTAMVRTTRQPSLDETVQMAKPTETSIRSEIGAQFPHIVMQIVERASTNAYGPYGLALGRASDNVHCLYMWQWIDENRLPQGSEFIGPASIRIRLCLPHTTFDAMALLADHLVVGRDATFRIAAAHPETVGRTDVIVEPLAEADSDAPAAKETTPHKRHLAKLTTRKRTENPDQEDHGTQSAALPVATTPILSSEHALPSDLPPQAYLGPKASPQQSNLPH